jgi:hypothetical protein
MLGHLDFQKLLNQALNHRLQKSAVMYQRLIDSTNVNGSLSLGHGVSPFMLNNAYYSARNTMAYLFAD